MEYPSEQSMLYVALRNGSVLQWMGSTGWNSQSIQSLHTLPHIRLIHPDWVKMGADAAGQQPVLCVCAQNVKMSNVPRDRLLSWETALSTIFFLIMHLTICSDRAFHFCVPNMMGFHNMAPEGLNEGVVLSHTHTLTYSAWEEFGSGVWELVFVLGELCSFLSFS